MRYPTLLFDLDHTLLDSDESERLAYAHTMATIGVEHPDDHFGRYVEINREMWRAVEAGSMQPGEVRHRRFERFNAEVGLDADAHEMAEAFVDGLCDNGELYPGVPAVLDALSTTATLGLITNGLSRVQRSRIDRLGIGELFTSIVISEEVGVTKPRPEIFGCAFEALGEPDRSGALMIGDSLTSDIAGGRNAGIDTCWYNPHGSASPGSEIVTHEIATLGDLIPIARNGQGRIPTVT